MLRIAGEVEAVYGGSLLLLVGEFEGVSPVHLEVVIEGASDETSPSTGHSHTGHCLLVVASGE